MTTDDTEKKVAIPQFVNQGEHICMTPVYTYSSRSLYILVKHLDLFIMKVKHYLMTIEHITKI